MSEYSQNKQDIPDEFGYEEKTASQVLRDWAKDLEFVNALDVLETSKEMRHVLFGQHDINEQMRSDITLSGQDRDALMHFYGSEESAKEHGSGTAVLAGLFHEFEGLIKGHSAPSIVVDLYNNLAGIYTSQPEGTEGYNFVDLYNKKFHTYEGYEDPESAVGGDKKSPNITEDEERALNIFIAHGLDKTFNPPATAKGGFGKTERGILGQWWYGTDSKLEKDE